MTDVNKTIEALGQAFEEFKATHTAEVKALKDGAATGDLKAKLEKVEAALDTHQKEIEDAHTKLASAQQGAPGAGMKDKEYSAAFQAHMKRGDIQASLNKGTASEGGYLAPVEWDRTISNRLLEISPMRALCAVQSISTNGFSKLFATRGTTSGWVGEVAARPVTGTSTFASLAYNTGEIYANPSASQQMLDDAEINLEAWLAGEVETEFAYQEGLAFLNGDGVNKPTGLLTYITGAANAAVHPYGAIGTVKTGAAAALTSDGLIDLTASLPTEISGSAKMIANRNTITAIRKLKDGQGNYLWQPSFVAGTPATVNGYGIAEVAGMPDVAAGSKPIVFGDFKRGYLVLDRTGVRVLRDPYSAKPYISLYVTKRVGGGLLHPDYLKALNVAA